MSVSGEGAALRSARTWLLLLCSEIPDRSEGRGQNRLQRRKGAMAWRMALLGSNMASLRHTRHKRRNTQVRVEGAFSCLNWRLCTGSCSAGSTRPDADLRPPAIATFGRYRPSAAVDRGSRPSAAAADRGIENRCNAGPYRANLGIVRTCKAAGSARAGESVTFALLHSLSARQR